MKSTRMRHSLYISAATLAMMVATSPAVSQDAAASATATSDPSFGDIIVTARKRQESLLKVPVVETALPLETLQRLQTNDLKNVATLVPGLVVGNQLLSIGTQVSIRGIGTSSSDPGVDQSVSLNIDGLQMASGLAYGSGMFDVGQIEVLKGPQALFFGKSSPGGVISVRTLDPTNKFELIGRSSYEFEADETRSELIVSGPISDTLKARVGGAYSHALGFFENDAVATGFGGRTPDRRAPRSESYQLRGTLLWNPSSVFDARLKVNLVQDRANNAEGYQLASCPDGVNAPAGINFFGAGEDCKLDRKMNVLDMDPAAYGGTLPNNGTPYLRNNQRYGTLELNYHPSSDLTVTSVTGYYLLHSSSLVQAIETAGAGGPLAVTNSFRRRDITEEVRVNSDFSSPFNFTLGGFYQDGNFTDRIAVFGNTTLGVPAHVQEGAETISIKTYSAFGQARWKILPNLELAAGARYTDETRRSEAFDFLVNAAVLPVVPRINAKNVAPEVTLTYTPTDDLTLFGSYKKGYKSGSYSVGTPLLFDPAQTSPAPPPYNSTLDNSFGDEKVEGGEIGLKSRLLDRRLSINLAGYYYNYSGLQVGVIEPPRGAITIIQTVNAGAARVYGLDFDVAYRPPAVTGLNLRASANYNHARFTMLNNAPCYGGQTIAAGCSASFNAATGLYTAQNLKGLPLVRAPDWQANFGFDYELPVGRNMKLILANSNQFSSRYLTALTNRSDVYQGSFLKADLSATLQGPDNRWEIALIGKNVGNRITSSSCVTSNYAAGVVIPNTQVTGGTGRGIAGVDEVGCFADRGREILLRLTVRPFS